MRKLQYLFMTLSVLFMAVPAFAQTAVVGRAVRAMDSLPSPRV